MYKVITDFIDLQDKCHSYKTGDTYPHDGKEIGEARIKELSGSDNALGQPLIKKAAARKKKE